LGRCRPLDVLGQRLDDVAVAIEHEHLGLVRDDGQRVAGRLDLPAVVGIGRGEPSGGVTPGNSN
jgi:hypothetical protein